MAIAETLITEHLDSWTSAIKAKSTAGRGGGKKQELSGIKKLRELILELAVRGLLVQQDPDDEPASELLKKIAKEKAELVSQGNLKKTKPLPFISDEKDPFLVPNNWKWTILDELGITHIGLTYSPKEISQLGGITVLRSSNIQNGRICLSGIVKVDKEVNSKLIVIENDLLVCARNGSKRLVGKCALIKGLTEPMTFGAFMAIFRSSLNPYIKLFLESPIFRHKLEGVTTTTINQLTQGNLRSTTIPLPPLAEQHRIVAKVDELMALCDRMEQQQEDSLQTHQTLVKTLLGALTAASESGQFNEAWKRLESNFDTLFTTESSIDELKQTILQLAVMGKLVEQHPAEGTADELLTQIEKAKYKDAQERKVRGERIRKTKPLLPINEDEIPFEIPKGWAWEQLGNLGFNYQNGVSTRKGSGDISTVVLRLADIKAGRVSLNDTRQVPLSEKDAGKYCLMNGDILVTRVNGSAEIVGAFTIAGLNATSCCYCDHFIRMRDNDHILNTDYVCLFGKSRACRNRIEELFITTAGQKTINQGHLSSLVFPLPPLAEQKRIVAKVDELMDLCDRLKANIQTAQTTQLNLADSLVEKAIKFECKN